MQNRRHYLLSLALAAVFSMPAWSQKSPKPGDRVIREENGCKYEVISGLAEIVSVEKIVLAEKSPLHYDEYDVKFRFIPKEGGELMGTLRDTELPLLLKYKSYQLRPGPDYIKNYQVRVGLKFAMKMLQNRNGECPEKYFYESNGLPNDIAEARPHLNDYEKDYFEKKQSAVEANLAKNEFDNTTNPNNIPDEEPIKPNVNDPKNGGTTVVQPNPTTTNPSTNSGSGTTTNPGTTDEPDNTEEPLSEEMTEEERIKAKYAKELEAQVRRELEAERLRKEQEEAARKKAMEEENRKKAAQDAKIRAKEEEAKRKEEEAKRKAEEEAKRLAEEERKRKEEAIKAQVKSELEAKLREEMRQKEQEEALRKAEEERKRQEEERLKQAALAREENIRKAREAEALRSSCSYADKVSGTIEIVETRKSKEAGESVWGYAEYEVVVRFTPDNLDEIPKKDRKIWEETHLFVLDAKGKSANPSARYIRQFNVFKGAKYKGFAQPLQSGICNRLMLFSPDLPADAGQVKN